jgi:hypothetical protein
MRRVTCALAATCALVWTTSAHAQDKVATDSLYIDFAVPDLPALAALGLNPSKVSRPGTLKELSVSVFPLAGSDSSIGPGVAIAWAPVYTFAKDVDSYRGPVLRRLAFSLVTSKEGKTDAVNAGAGIRVMLFDKTDPVLSSKPGADCTDPARAKDYECQVFKILESEDGPTRRSDAFLKRARSTLLKVAELMATPEVSAGVVLADLLEDWDLRRGPTPFTAMGLRAAFDRRLAAIAQKQKLPAPTLPEELSNEVGALAEEYIAQGVIVASSIGPKLAKLRESTEDERWNWAVSSVDLGIVGQSPTGSWSELEGKKYGGLVSMAFPVGTRSQVVAQLEGRHGIGDDATERSYVGGGGRWLIGTSSKRFSFETYVADTEETDPTKDGRSLRYTFGAEFRFVKGLWLEVAFGTEDTPASTGSHLLSFANLKYAFKSSPRFTTIPGSVED